MSPTPQTPNDLDPSDLQTPLIVNIAAAALACAAASMLMIATQIGLNISEAFYVKSWVYGLLAGYVVTGLGGAVCAVLIAKGKSLGAIGGVLFALSYLGLFWTPVLTGFVAVSSLLCLGFSVPALPLVGISIPFTRKLEKNRKAFMDSI